jgi:hypothetical protein
MVANRPQQQRLHSWLSMLALAMLSCMSLARPVSYVGGTTLDLGHHGDKTQAVLHYTPVRFWSIGYRYLVRKSHQTESHSLQNNFLVHRFNQPESQANIYLQASLGIAHQVQHDLKPNYDLGLMLDWEDRRFLLSYQNRYSFYTEAVDLFEHTARIGMAPYVGGYGDVHTWLMLQVDQESLQAKTWLLTPLVRLFYSVHLAEIGYSLEGSLLLNYTLRL